jgi:hypothetical protein
LEWLKDRSLVSLGSSYGCFDRHIDRRNRPVHSTCAIDRCNQPAQSTGEIGSA